MTEELRRVEVDQDLGRRKCSTRARAVRRKEAGDTAAESRENNVPADALD